MPACGVLLRDGGLGESWLALIDYGGHLGTCVQGSLLAVVTRGGEEGEGRSGLLQQGEPARWPPWRSGLCWALQLQD